MFDPSHYDYLILLCFRLWSSWDLTCLRDIEDETLRAKPVVRYKYV